MNLPLKRQPPLTGRSERKRQSVLAAATETFLKSGYLGASMDEIAASSGVSKQTIYKNFGSKEALFIEIVRRLTHAADVRVHTAPPEPTDVAAVERYLFDYAFRQLSIVLTSELMQLRRLVIGEAARFPELGKALYERGPKRAVSVLAGVFERLNARELLDCPDATVAATNFNWLAMAEPVNRAMFLTDDQLRPQDELRDVAREAVRVFLAAYGRR